MDKIKYNPPKNIISHIDSNKSDFEQALKDLKQKILKSNHSSDTSALEQMQIVEELKNFALGQFLILNQGLNGPWTQYIVLHPQYGRLTSRGIDGKPLSKLEKWILDKCPIVLATQERFFIFQRILQNMLKDSIKIASIPCGLMDDLLGLNYSRIKGFTLTGIDLDAQSLEMARDNAVQNHLSHHAEFIEKDAWDIKLSNQFDIITSNGLNVCEPDPNKNIMLYKNLYAALKKGGTLITSFLTNPPEKCDNCKWDMSQISEEDLRMQRILLGDVLNLRWQASYSDEKAMEGIIAASGFSSCNIIYDRQHLFPTVVATK